MLDPLTSPSSRRARPGTDTALEVSITRSSPGAAVLTVDGEIDTLTRPKLETAMAELLDAPGPRPVVDLSGVTFLASCGLAVLIRSAYRAESDGVRLRLVSTSRAVRRPLEITGSEQLFDLYTELHDATD